MHQFDTIMQAVAVARAAARMDVVPAILKHYLMDGAYVTNTERSPLLAAINKELDSKYSISFIKKANPALLETLEFLIPEKEQLIEVGSLKGETELHLHTAGVTADKSTQSLNNQEPADMTTTANVSVTLEDTNSNTAASATVTPASGPKKAKTKNKQANTEGFETNLGKAIKKGKGKKADHVNFAMLDKGLTKETLGIFFLYIKESMKKMIAGFKEVEQLKTAAQREEAFDAWIESDKALKKEYKAFLKAADGQFEKSDHVLGMFLITSGSNIKNIADFTSFAIQHKPKSDSGYSFLRENDGGIRSGYAAVGAALVLGTLDQVQQGFTVGSIAGTLAGATASFYVAEQLDSFVSNTFLRIGMAAALGGGMGVGGSRLGSMLLDTPVYPGLNEATIDADDTTIVATVPASNSDASGDDQPSLLSRIPGIGSLFAA